MSWKSFLKPSLLKVILTVLFFVAPLLLVGWPSSGDEGPRYAGFPLPFAGSATETEDGGSSINWIVVAIDLIFWYIASCLLAQVLMREKKQA